MEYFDKRVAVVELKYMEKDGLIAELVEHKDLDRL